MLINQEKFEENFKLDVTKYTETKGNGSFQAKYISWANAQFLLKTRHPELGVEFERGENGSPIFQHQSQAFVLAYLTDGEKRTPSTFYPVWDNSFKAINDCGVGEVNKAMQRATAKAIAVHTGLGLSLYVGEDLEDATPTQATNQSSTTKHNGSGEDWETRTFPFGKHRSKTLLEIVETDPAYFEYLFSPKFEFKDDGLRNACEKAHAKAKMQSVSEAMKLDAPSKPKAEPDPDLDEDIIF